MYKATIFLNVDFCTSQLIKVYNRSMRIFLCVDSLGSFKRMAISPVNRYNLTSSSPICVHFFLLPITLVVFLSTIIREKMKDSCVSFLGLHETFSFSSLYNIGYKSVTLVFSYTETPSFCFCTLHCFDHKGVLSKIFCDMMLCFPLFSRHCSG